MFYYPTQILFIITLILGTLITISSNSWFGAWMGLELNLLSFIPLLSNNDMLSSEAALKYFLTQALASVLLFFSMIMYLSNFKMGLGSSLSEMLILSMFSSALFLKLGAAPFHFWFPGVMEGISWLNGLILMTWQKLGPTVLLSYVISMNNFVFCVAVMSVIVGALGGINQTSLRKIMAYSSINHLGWITCGLLLSNSYWLSYFLFYCFLSFTIIYMFYALQLTQLNQVFSLSDHNNFNKIFLFCNFLSLGGLPPFVGFLPKWLIIQGLISSNLIFLSFLCVSFTLIVLFYYLRVFFPSILIITSMPKWQIRNGAWTWGMSLLSSLSLLGLPLFPMIYFIF
uniref:NADH-ubiquinone oxidoreductase chain 2 n=1 Tax=Serratella sp. Yunnan-2018 TaxID=2748058 RepID=A0A7D6FJ60_9INSE|nr:NADH dehydrogenase subunit 2 [Serratella sp. Yunnan-2018]QLP88982.1 NADH dehydrogenase subunit 2 [Serratella sp. Yunnan-2018]